MNIERKHTLRKKEKLTNHRVISDLFNNGKSYRSGQVKIIFNQVDPNQDTPCKVVFTVSKRQFKHAVKRNRIKRLLREAYRQNKTHIHELLDKNNMNIALALIYTGKKLPEYKDIEKDFRKVSYSLITALADSLSE